LGNDGNDTLHGAAGDDILDGDDGNDRLYGNSGDDRLDGGNDNDFLAGNSDDDRLNGKSGNDVLIAGNGADRLTGEDGNDLLFDGTIVYNSPAPPVVGTDNSTIKDDADDQAMKALLQAWSAGTLNLANVTRLHDGFVDKLGGGAGTDTAYASPTAPNQDRGDWETLLP
jgi:Ca2+-binding RTX toxin-like protein